MKPLATVAAVQAADRVAQERGTGVEELMGRAGAAVAAAAAATLGRAAGRRAIAPLLGAAPPVAELVRPVPYLAIQSMLDGQRLKRLTALKDRWDPANVFHMNANIPPSRPGRR